MPDPEVGARERVCPAMPDPLINFQIGLICQTRKGLLRQTKALILILNVNLHKNRLEEVSGLQNRYLVFIVHAFPKKHYYVLSRN